MDGIISGLGQSAISEATNELRRTLKECTSVERLMVNEWAENRLMDFNLWDAGVGASSKSRACLDERLIPQPAVRTVVLGLLSALKALARDCITFGHDESLGTHDRTNSTVEYKSGSSTRMSQDTAEDDPFASWSDQSSLNSTDSESTRSQKPALEQAMEDVESVLKQLIRLGMAIRASGTVSRLRKADVNFTFRDYQHLEDDCYEHSHQVDLQDLRALKSYLMTILLAHPLPAVTDQPQDSERPLDLTSELEKLEEIQRQTIDQLVFANLRRRNRFSYAKRHAEKLAVREEASRQEETTEPARIFDATANTEQHVGSEEVPKPTPKDKDKASPVLPTTGLTSETSPSEGVVDARALEPAAPSQGSMSRVSKSLGKSGWPHPPLVDAKRGSFRCPCCYQTLGKRESEQRPWRNHLSGDIHPFTCIFPDCTAETPLFISRDAWKTHLRQEHRSSDYWECFACTNAETSEIFQSPNEFMDHMQSRHDDAISKLDASKLVDICIRSTPATIKTCPLCVLKPQDTDLDPEALLDHIADHIHDFSLLSLPWADSLPESVALVNKTASRKVKDWLHMTKMDDDDTADHPSGDDPTPKILLDYFADSGSVSCAEISSGVDGTSQALSSDLTFDSQPNSVPDLDHDSQSVIDSDPAAIDLQHMPDLGPFDKTSSELINTIEGSSKTPGFHTMTNNFGVAANVLTLTEISEKVSFLCLQYWKDDKGSRDDITRLQKEITTLQALCESVKELLDGPHKERLEASQQLRDKLNTSRRQLEQLNEELTPGKGRAAMRRFGLRAFKWPFKAEDVEHEVENIGRSMQHISHILQTIQTSAIFDLDQKAILSRLPIAIGAAFNSHSEEHNATCLPDTRVQLLAEIDKWVDNTEGKCIFWLNGMAGTGKSTVSRTVARSFHDRCQLGGSFFFKRGEGERGGASRFFTTLATQLVKTVPGVAPHVKKAMDDDPAISTGTMRDQFEKLVLGPLSQSQVAAKPSTSTILIVVDALDECEREEDVRTIIHLFSKTRTLQSPRLRIFATSRPELPIRLGFNDIDGMYQGLILHEIEPAVMEHDLTAYFNHELARIKFEYNQSVLEDRRKLPTDWPRQSEIEALVAMATSSFITASTTCRFLADRSGDPSKKLEMVLKQQTESQGFKLNARYLPVLDQMLVELSDRERREVTREFRDIVGPIVVLESPLCASALARLLDMEQDIVDATLDRLHSVLDVPSLPDLPVKLFHLSFRDFLLQVEDKQFRIDEKETHRKLAEHCLRVMNRSLRQDICGIQWPGTRLSSVETKMVNECIPPEVQYACRYWTFHLERAGCLEFDGDLTSDSGLVYGFLQKHFLHWLEVLTLVRENFEKEYIIEMLEPLLKPESCRQIRAFLDDAAAFIQMAGLIVWDTPLQIYCSALLFAPEKSVIRTMFRHEIPSWISLKSKVATSWDINFPPLEGHEDWVRSVAFSSDLKLVASGSNDTTVRLWSAETGALYQILEGHKDLVTSVAFSGDSKLVASGSYDNTVRLWSVDTGALYQILEGHKESIASVAFSSDSKLVASGSYDDTVRLWSVETGALYQILEGHKLWVTSVAISGDSKLVASGSYDKTVRLWSVDTGAPQRTFDFGTYVDSLQFQDNDQCLLTDTGVISLNNLPQPTPLTQPDITELSVLSNETTPNLIQSHRVGYGIRWGRRNQMDWITLDGNDLLVLPYRYANCSSISGSKVAIGYEFARVLIMEFCTRELLKLSNL